MDGGHFSGRACSPCIFPVPSLYLPCTFPVLTTAGTFRAGGQPQAVAHQERCGRVRLPSRDRALLMISARFTYDGGHISGTASRRDCARCATKPPPPCASSAARGGSTASRRGCTATSAAIGSVGSARSAWSTGSRWSRARARRRNDASHAPESAPPTEMPNRDAQQSDDGTLGWGGELSQSDGPYGTRAM